MVDRELSLDALAASLRVLADPNRLRIIDALLDGERCNCELGGSLGLPANLVSHHLRSLEQAGFVLARRDPDDARWIHYRVVAPQLDALLAAVGRRLKARPMAPRRTRACSAATVTTRST
jgi:ArsR family transcriptional regulator